MMLSISMPVSRFVRAGETWSTCFVAAQRIENITTNKDLRQ
jgi:hypothetical protein